MVSAFLGTLIGLEKAVAFGKRFAYLGPLATGLGGVGLILSPLAPGPRFLLFAGSLGFGAVASSFFNRHRTLANFCVVEGAALWSLGNGLWLSGWPLFTVVPLWVGFLFLTIAGERLELNRLMGPSRASRALFSLAVTTATAGMLVAVLAFITDTEGRIVFAEQGQVFSSGWYAVGVRILGLGLTAGGIWLLRNDMARAALREPGLTRFIGVSLLAGPVLPAALNDPVVAS